MSISYCLISLLVSAFRQFERLRQPLADVVVDRPRMRARLRHGRAAEREGRKERDKIGRQEPAARLRATLMDY